MKKTALIAVAAWAVCSPALAQQNWEGAGYFDLIEIDGACLATAEFVAEGRANTRFLLADDAEGVKISLTSMDWSKPESVLEVSFEFLPNGKTYVGNAAPLTLSSVYNGFVMMFDDQVLTEFAAADSLRVTRGDVVIDHLDLKGSAATTATLRRCTSSALAKEAARQRERDRFSDIPKDPFAR